MAEVLRYLKFELQGYYTYLGSLSFLHLFFDILT